MRRRTIVIVSCGEALVDMVPHPVPGGGPMNVAVASARLGVPSAFIGRISTDDYGDTICRHLQSNDVDIRACERGPEPTARAFVRYEPDLVFTFEGTGTADTQLRAADLGKLGDGPFILHGGTLGLFRGRTAETLARLADATTGLVSLDPNIRPRIIDQRARWDHYHRRWLKNTHIYKVSDDDLEWIWPGRDPSSCAEELLDGGVLAVLATHGSAGATVYTRDTEIRVAGQEVQVVDTIGAGDTFIASVLASLWERQLAGHPAAISALDVNDWIGIAERGVALATITCSRSGADPPYLADLPAEPLHPAARGVAE